MGASSEDGSDGLRRRTVTRRGDDDEEINFLEQQPLTVTERSWAKAVTATCAFDLVASGVIICTSLKYAYRDGGVSLYSMGFQAISHYISSLLIVLRLVAELRTEHALLLDARRVQLKREQCLSVVMGIVMLISSCALLFKGFRKIKFWNKWYDDMLRRQMDSEVLEITEWLAWTGFSIYMLQALVRGAACRNLRCGGLLSHAFVASLVSLIYLFVLGLGASYQREWSWKAEPIAACWLTIVTLAEGVRIIFNYLDDMDDRLKNDSKA
jgi:hypothetical protein